MNGEKRQKVAARSKEFVLLFLAVVDNGKVSGRHIDEEEDQGAEDSDDEKRPIISPSSAVEPDPRIFRPIVVQVLLGPASCHKAPP